MTYYTYIYIPIWLDLLFVTTVAYASSNANLHSNMVRFIIVSRYTIAFINKMIYIPIWLDLLFAIAFPIFSLFLNLHSNMVRFIINIPFADSLDICEFTFQYG